MHVRRDLSNSFIAAGSDGIDHEMYSLGGVLVCDGTGSFACLDSVMGEHSVPTFRGRTAASWCEQCGSFMLNFIVRIRSRAVRERSDMRLVVSICTPM